MEGAGGLRHVMVCVLGVCVGRRREERQDVEPADLSQCHLQGHCGRETSVPLSPVPNVTKRKVSTVSSGVGCRGAC